MTDNIKAFLKGFSYAANGVKHCVKTQRNMRFHLCAAAAVIAAAYICGLGGTEKAVLILTISAVISSEAFNTAIESAVDLCTKEKQPLAKAAKDCAAGAVLITAAAAVFIGIYIFCRSDRIGELFAFFAKHPTALPAAAGYLIFCVWFVFRK